MTPIQYRPHREKLQYLRGILAAIDWQEQMRVRAIREAIRMATAEFWERRATDFEWVMQERFTDPLDACTEGMEPNRATALSCRRHAHLLRTGFFAEPWWGFDEDFADILAERQVA
ncbi:hypothetical protein [Naumannella halotolerans]|uniref:Uncharacterized protein n=1 Tax=Naumannella halotolerans TaxID=993414 RepID=A0A4R7J3F9_9ACTN|nr:hypothetical protein [Naumannella halotolerans]TDT30883.1 hypothetical protein CLV29_2290 [Naumannella halotolerans]